MVRQTMTVALLWLCCSCQAPREAPRAVRAGATWRDLLALPVAYEDAFALSSAPVESCVAPPSALSQLVAFSDYLQRRYPHSARLPLYLTPEAAVFLSSHQSFVGGDQETPSMAADKLPLVEANQVPVSEALKHFAHVTGVQIAVGMYAVVLSL